MGLLLDSTYLIAAQRRKLRPRDAFQELHERSATADLAISVVSVMELAHGIVHGKSPEQTFRSERFLHETLEAMIVHPVTLQVALRAGRLEGLLAAQGKRIATADLLIASTALELGYRVATGNLRHFERIPGLEVLVL